MVVNVNLLFIKTFVNYVINFVKTAIFSRTVISVSNTSSTQISRVGKRSFEVGASYLKLNIPLFHCIKIKCSLFCNKKDRFCRDVQF